MDVDIALMIQNILKEKWNWQRNLLNLRMMDLKEIERQLKELQKKDFANMHPDQIQEIIDQLLDFTDTTENQLNEDIQKQVDDEQQNS